MIAVTFDVDDVNWVNGSEADEMNTAVPAILDVLDEFPLMRTTWFVRLDAGIAHARGRADALFLEYATTFARMRAAGHEIGWHHHAVRPGTSDVPATDSADVCEALRTLAPYARALGLESVRLGWSFADAAILTCLDALGFPIDSTALPRPSYPWDTVPRDWEGAPQRPYRPSRYDHRNEGTVQTGLLEVPISVAVLPTPEDTQADVQRYVNPAYHRAYFERAVQGVSDSPLIVTVTHPYECVTPPTSTTRASTTARPSHPLLSFDPDVFRHNLAYLHALERPFVTLNSLRT